MNRKVTLQDFIKDEFKGKDPEDYEFRADGKIVRKDRWETAIHRIHGMLQEYSIMPNSSDFEISDVVGRLQYFIQSNSWYSTKDGYFPPAEDMYDSCFIPTRFYHIITKDGHVHIASYMCLKYDGHSGEKVFSLCIPKISGGKYCLHDSLDWDIEIDENAEQHDVLYWKHLRDFPFDTLLYKDN